MTQVAAPDKAVGDFNDFHVAAGDGQHDIRLHLANNQLWYDLISTGAAKTNRWPITLMTGSHHMQVYWASDGHGRTLIDMPLIWLRKDRRWVPRNAAFLTPHNETLYHNPGDWNEFCIHCHTTHGRTRRPERGVRPEYDTLVADFGISCEACHGPGAEHVAHYNSDPHAKTTLPPNRDVVNPANFSPHKSSKVCGSCHSAHIERTMDSRHHFRPGDDLGETRHLLHVNTVAEFKQAGAPSEVLADISKTHENTFWPDGVIRVLGREYTSLLESPCHQRGEQGCLSCHELHAAANDPRALAQWADDQLKPGMRGDLACTQCHEPERFATTEHTHHPTTSEGARCQNCHLPNTAYGLLKMSRNHTVESPSVRVTLDTGRPNGCNLCHLDRSLGWTARHLADWYSAAMPPLTSDQTSLAGGVLWSMTGDANQRAMIAWHMGWKPARRASGTDWMTPVLAELMQDPYAAVRYLAGHSIRGANRSSDNDFDFIGSPEHRSAVTAAIRAKWAAKPRPAASRLLIGPDGTSLTNEFQRLLQKRDRRVVKLSE